MRIGSCFSAFLMAILCEINLIFIKHAFSRTKRSAAAEGTKKVCFSLLIIFLFYFPWLAASSCHLLPHWLSMRLKSLLALTYAIITLRVRFCVSAN